MQTIAIVAALKEEIRPLERVIHWEPVSQTKSLCEIRSGRLEGSPLHIVFVALGVGKTLAAAGVQHIIDLCSPEHIFLIGSCGGATHGVEPGDIIIPSETAQSDYDLTCAGYVRGEVKSPKGLLPARCRTNETFNAILCNTGAALLSIEGRTPSIKTGLMTSRDTLETNPAILQTIESRFPHIGWDMEAAAINLVAHLNGIPCNIVKGTLDRHGVYDKTLAHRIEESVYENSFRIVREALTQF